MMRWLLFAILLVAGLARADTPLALSQTYAGKLNFTGTVASLRTQNDNAHACWVTTSGSGQISDIPTGATIVSAKLYWAGSGAVPDNVITFNGGNKTATSQYTAVDENTNAYFSGSVDVTAEVNTKRNGTYTFSALTFANGGNHCVKETVFGGFQLLVIYSTTAEQYRKLTVYDGFQYLRNGGKDFSENGILVPSPLGTASAVVGHLSWSGTSTVDNGENLKLNGVAQTDAKNHAGELFSSKSNVASANAYGLDFDKFTSTSLTAGQTSVTARIETGTDGVFVSAVVLALPVVGADLAITKVRNGPLVVGSNTTYTLSVSNAGPSAEPGIITVTDKLPAELSFVSAAGVGWDCSAVAQDVTCTRAGSLASGATASAITVTVKVLTGGTIVNSAKVAGTAYDAVQTNNTATDTSSAAKADLSITKALTGTMTVGQNATYVLKVANAGPDAEPGPITVIDTLPAGLTYVSASGTGWSCSASGQMVTCTRAGTLASGAETASISVTVKVVTEGDKTNTATAKGTAYDETPATTSVKDKALPSVSGVAGYVFTDKACTVGVAIGEPGQCVDYPGGSVIAGNSVSLFITATKDGLPAVPDTASPVLNFAFRCLNPQSGNGVAATFGGVPLGTCLGKVTNPSAWTTATLAFGGQATATVNFSYDDVGSVELLMQNGSATESALVLFNPFRLRVTEVKYGSTSNPEALQPDDGKKFAAAGDPFSITIIAETTQNHVARNFGREDTPETFGFDILAVPMNGVNVTEPPPALEGAFPAPTDGAAKGVNFLWPEVGSLRFQPKLGLDPSIYVLADPSQTASVVIGRFYPHHFNTVVIGPLSCLTHMVCGELSAAFARQPFSVQVSARNAADGLTSNYNGRMSREVTLSAWNLAGGATANPGWTVAATPLTANRIAVATFELGETTLATPNYALPIPYVTGAAPATNWTAPTSVFLRADETSGVEKVTSNVGAAPVEGGVRILNGRLHVGNVHGSERLRLTVPLAAQYWTGTAWEGATTDGVSEIDSTGTNTVFDSFTGKLTVVRLSPASAAIRPLVSGVLGLVLEPPLQTGSVNATLNNPAWLPSTRGRIHFGTYRSPIIYVREVF
jgi:MSHA biogenesis protein MshQ